MKFTERELCLLSDGILQLIGNANSATRLISPSARSDVRIAMEAYRDELNTLNGKICDAMDDAEKEEQR